MDLIEKARLLALVTIGKRQEALNSIKQTYGVNDEEAQKLLAALEAEPQTQRIDAKRLWRWAGFGVFLVGIVFVAIGVMRFFAYESTDERQLTTITCTVADVHEYPDGLEVTFTYTYKDQVYSKKERNEIFRKLGFSKGQQLELMVNVLNPDDAVLPALKPYVQAAGMRYGAFGLGLILVSIVLWRMMRPR